MIKELSLLQICMFTLFKNYVEGLALFYTFGAERDFLVVGIDHGGSDFPSFCASSDGACGSVFV
jgi:hypothetical protein